jgi:DNA-binding Lrp family transcriptional regulator
MTDGPSLGALRVAARLSNAFTLDLVKLGAHGRDVIDPLIRTAILHANLAQVIRDPDLMRRYATLDEDVPDALRRPASINAIATSLRIPFETARRRIGGLAEQGVCLITPAGVIVPRAATDTAFYRFACQVQFEKLHQLYDRLRAAGCLEAPPPVAAAPYAGGDPPYRLAGRLVAQFVLRFTEPLAEHIPDRVTQVALLDLICANTEHLSDDDAGDDGVGPSGFVPDARRRPITVAILADRLGVAHETMRRHVVELTELGLCQRVDGGYIVPAEALARPAFVRFLFDNHRHLTRMFAGLADFGVLATWDETRRGAAA